MQFDAVAPYLWGDRFLAQRHGVLRAYHQAITSGRGDLRSSQGVDAAASTRQMEGLLEWDIRDRLGALKDPVLFLAGAEDLLTPPWKCLETARLVPHSRFEVVLGIGHSFPVEAPKDFTKRVSEFIDGLANIPLTRG